MHAIVIWADGLAAHWLGAYGNEWVSTPHLNRIAAGGVVFDMHFTDAVTGRPTARHSFTAEPGSEVGTMLDELRLDWIETTQLLPPWETSEEILAEYFADDPAGEELPNPLDEPPAGPFDDRTFDAVQRSFAAAVTAFDADVGELLKTHDPENQALVLITSGHGQILGDHVELSSPLAEARVHVPLLVCWPNRLPAGGRVSALTQSVDLLPTLLDAFGLPIPADCHGHSLLPLARGEVAAARPYLVLGAQDDSAWALRTPGWYYCWPKAIGADGKLFRKPDDRWEVNDLRQQQLDWCDQVEATLRAYAAAAGKPGKLEVPNLPEAPQG